MNLPIITTNGVGLNQVISDKDAGYIVRSNVEELEVALTNICNHKIRENMVGNGRKIILENHIWENIVDNLIQELSN